VQDLALTHERSLPLQQVTLSLGVATLEAKALLSDAELVKRADDALYQAKATGRNRVVAFQGGGEQA